MKIATLGVVLRPGRILLGEKKRGEIGTGMLSGPGGKLDPGETLEECLMRETREELEIELDPASLKYAVRIDFYAAGESDFRVHVYLARVLSGRVHETAEMIPKWYPLPLDKPTLDRMYEADRHWLPRAVRGEKFRANVYYHERAKGFDRIEFLPFSEVI